MIWQDYVIAAACFGLALALIPSIRGKHKPERSTCLMMMFAVATLAVCFGTLRLWVSMAAECTGTTAWAILLWQTMKRSGCSGDSNKTCSRVGHEVDERA